MAKMNLVNVAAGFFIIIALLYLANSFGVINVPGLSIGANSPNVNPPAPIATGSNGLTGACVLSSPQVLAVQVTDADRPGTVLAPTNTVYLNAQTGQLNPGGTTTSPGSSYNVLSNTTNYFKGLGSFTTDCAVSPPAALSEKGVDTAVGTAVFNSDGVTSNAVTNLSVGANAGAAAIIKLSQSASYKHLGGVDGRFAVYVNATNVTDWNPSQMSITFNGVACTPLGSASPAVQTSTPTAIGGVIIYSAVCTGDFPAQSSGTPYNLVVGLYSSSGANPGIQDVGVNFAGVDYYKNTVSGVVQLGAVKDDGSAIQAMQGATIHVQ